MRIALCVEYDGSAFRGWQTQTGGGTVQDALEAALSEIASEPISVVCAGRTDAGVHATSQVVHFDCLTERPLSAWVRGSNALLPASVAVRWAHLVADDFHARFSAFGRRYRYVLLNRPQRPALAQGQVGWFHLPLDVEAMQAGAKHLEQLQHNYQAAGVQAHCVAFIDDMAGAYEWADLVICRAGALTVAELAAAGVASILVPFPYAVDDHQTANAKFLSSAGGAILLPQNEMTPESISLLRNYSRGQLQQMAERARAMARPHAAAEVARVCEEVVK